MDFASILASEIASKKRKLEAAATASTPEPKKYIKRADLELAREQEYIAKQAALDAEREEKARRKREEEEEDEARREEQKRKREKLKEEARLRREKREAEKAAAEAKAKGITLPNAEEEDKPLSKEAEKELCAQFRKLKEPIRIFGETTKQRQNRLEELTRQKPVDKPFPPPLTEQEMIIKKNDVTEDTEKVYGQLAAWFDMVLREWSLALAARPEEVARTSTGRQAKNAYIQAKEHMEPLFRHFKDQDLHPDVFPRVCDIVMLAQDRKYVNANDVYLRLSIGNAAWPIGVTMVGIHERSAREKLHEKGKAAHIMSDEVTRKFLQSIKRCLSFCQTRWPPSDPLQLMG